MAGWWTKGCVVGDFESLQHVGVITQGARFFSKLPDFSMLGSTVGLTGYYSS